VDGDLAGQNLYEEICTEMRTEQLHMTEAVKPLCDIRAKLLAASPKAAQAASPGRQESLPASWLSRRISSLSVSLTVSTAAVSEIVASQIVIWQSMAQAAEGIQLWTTREVENSS